MSLKNLGQGDGAWYTQKTVLRWGLGTISRLLLLPPRIQDKLAAALASIPRKAHTTSLSKWSNLLGILRSITPSVSGLIGMFTRVQHVLKRAVVKHVQLTTDKHNDLEAWRKIVCSLSNRSSHLHELETFSPTWFWTTNAAGSVMGGVF